MIKAMFLYFKSKIPKSVLFFLTLLYHSLSYIFLKIRYPKLKYFKNFPSNFSQAGQDEIIYNHFFYGMYKGFFCDVGSNDPVVLSNTLFFEKLGWTGIAFDPQSNLLQQWRKLRTCQFFPLALSDEVKYVKFRLVNDHVGWENMLSFIEDTNKENLDYSDSILDIQTST